MELYRYRITPLSAFATPLRSDTLYGHLLWAAALLKGAAQVQVLIEAFAGRTPPFVLSSALPAGQLPVPVMPGIPRYRFKSEFGDRGNLFDLLQKYKAHRKNACWPLKLWERGGGKISAETLFSNWLAEESAAGPNNSGIDSQPAIATEYQPHVAIDRRSGSVMNQGGLFFSKATWYRPGTELDLYVRTADPDTFESLFRYVEAVGFGADRTTGKGQFRFIRDTRFEPAIFEIQGDHRLSLSVCTAADLGLFRGYWGPMIKHGRTWNGFGEKNPFKKPFFSFVEGSLFSRMPEGGYLLRGIHSNPAVVQVGWPLTIPVTLEEQHAD